MKTNTHLIKILIAGITVVFLAVLYFIKDARHPGFFPACPFHSLTGLYCPGCGSQRAISSLLHGNVYQALSYNSLLVASLPLLMCSAYGSVISVFRTQKANQAIFYNPVVAKIILALVLTFWLLRNIPVYPFLILAPK